ncbi:Zinc finger protein 582 [Frankliniella fusca]|uniref:Zinc finger protein 582 n=1 Tax=Frankliniella fusca TaxID=407009 RepID=A0AAE1HJZ2_9NEOP|nr:Zinc finger protein 582 [Frankliniella fusca]
MLELKELNDMVCRLCLLSDSSQLLNLSALSNSEEDNVTFSKICWTLKCKISISDNHPKFICRECAFTIEFVAAYNLWFKEVSNQVANIQHLFESCVTDTNAIISKLKERNSSRPEPLLQSMSNSLLYSSFYTSLMDNIFSRMSSDYSKKFNPPSDKQRAGESNSLEAVVTIPFSQVDKNSTITSVNEDGEPFSTPFNDGDNLRNSSCEENSSHDVSSPVENLTDIKLDFPTNIEELTCPECNKVFKKRNLLMRHLSSHQGALGKYQCQICRRKFISTSEVQRHTRAHMGLKPYKCKLCLRYFSQKNLLDNHMYWHEGRKSHLCDVCGKSFSSGPNLKTHKNNLHSLEKTKPYNCKECGKSFSRKHHLENHFTIHVSLRPFQCTLCGLTFKRSSQLQEHEIVHTGKKHYDCTVCKKAFRTKRVLNVHKLLHSGLKAHQCTICPQSFVRKGGLTVHMKTHSR